MHKKYDLKKKVITLEKIISLLPGHIYWKDMNGVYLGCNYYQAKSLGFESIAEIIGKTDYELPWREQADELVRIDKKIIATKQAIKTEEFVVLPDGKKGIR